MTNLPESKKVTDLAAVDYSELLFPMLVVYDRPKDFPENAVIRVWDMTTPTNVILVAADIAEAEAAVPPWFTRLERAELDDPKIVAVYV